MKMKQVYEANPQLGDPMTIQGQLTENGQKLDKLRAEQKKFQVKICNILNQESSKVYFSLGLSWWRRRSAFGLKFSWKHLNP